MSRICVQCSTENDDNFSFCKYCGASLPIVDRFSDESSENDASSSFEERAAEIDFDGVTYDQLKTYIGKDSHRILPKFINIKLFGRKLNWSFPVLILGFLFGFFGMAVYFFSRKMFPIAIILTLCGIVFTAGSYAVNYNSDKVFFEEYRAFINDITQNTEKYLGEDGENLNTAMLSIFEKYETNRNTRLGNIMYFADLWLVRSALPVFLSGFTNYFYYLSANKRIKKAKLKLADSPDTNEKIAHLGGFSVATLFIPIAVNLVMGIIYTLLVII